MTYYVVTVEMPIYVGIEADDEEQAKGIAKDHWDEQRVAEKLTQAVDWTDFYVGGDVDIWESNDIDVSIDDVSAVEELS